MRIGLLTTSFPRYEGDVAGAFVLGFAQALVARGHSVDVLAPEPAVGGPPPRWPNIEVTWVPYARPRLLERTFYGAGVPDNLRRNPAAWPGVVSFPVALAAAARRRGARWDALVSHWALPCGLVGATVRGDRPHLAVHHSADVHALARLPLGAQLMQRIHRGSTALLFVSERHRDQALARLPAVERVDAAGRAHVCPMGVSAFVAPAGNRRALRRRLGLDRFTILSMGRLVPIKGVDVALRSLAGARKMELVIAGEGPERERLARLATETGGRTRFVGRLEGERKADFLAASDAFVLPSRRLPSGRSEGVPHAVIEALAAGLPVVASDTGALDAVVEHSRTGLLVPPDEPRALRATLEHLASDRNLRRRLRRGATRTGAQFFWPELAPHLEALLQPPRVARSGRRSGRGSGRCERRRPGSS